MGRLLDAGPGSARVELRGQSMPLREHGDAGALHRVGFQEPNSLSLVERVVQILDRGDVPVLAHPRWPATLAKDALRRAGAGARWRGAPIATLLFTSGSTAAPKVVAHSLEAHIAAARASGDRTPYGPDHRWLLSLPLCHVGGLSLLFRTVVAGATLVLPEPEDDLASALVKTRPSHLSLVATQLRDLLDDDEATAALTGCEAVLLGGGPAPIDLIRAARDRGVALRRTYGMTEMGSQIATETSGRLLPLRGAEAMVDAQGELLVRGVGMFEGYLEEEELLQPLNHGWFATGDLAQIAADGALEILGRRDNQFVSGGENIRPEAIEAALAERGITAVIVPVTDERYGARPAAFTADGGAHDELAAELLPSFARPIAWLTMPPLRGHKPNRRQLTQIAESERRGGA